MRPIVLAVGPLFPNFLLLRRLISPFASIFHFTDQHNRIVVIFDTDLKGLFSRLQLRLFLRQLVNFFLRKSMQPFGVIFDLLLVHLGLGLVTIDRQHLPAVG